MDTVRIVLYSVMAALFVIVGVNEMIAARRYCQTRLGLLVSWALCSLFFVLAGATLAAVLFP
jgi:hypothetical protein